MIIVGQTPIDSLKMNFNFVDNDESNLQYQSEIDGNDQGYYLSGINSIPQEMRVLGNTRTWHYGRAFVRKIGDFSDTELAATGSDIYYQRFEVVNEVIVTPYYLEELTDYLGTGKIPPFLSGDSSLKYGARFEFRTELANANSSKVVTDLSPKGSIGWFDQNYNQFFNKFNILSTSYVDSDSNTQSQLVYGEETTVSIVVDSEDVFSVGQNVVLYLSRLPSFGEYSEGSDTFENIWMYDSVHATIDGPQQSGNLHIQDVQVSLLTPNQIEIIANINAVSDYIGEDSEYILAVDVATIAPSGLSDKVLLLADRNKWSYDACVLGLAELLNFSFYDHPQLIGLDSDGNVTNQGYSNFGGFIEDGVLFDMQFSKLNSASASDFVVKLIAKRGNEVFELTKQEVAIDNNLMLSDQGNEYQFLSCDYALPYNLSEDR
jgi:hypothetical protein